jgi:5-methylcytosine-specific restriction endonuclease McrA
MTSPHPPEPGSGWEANAKPYPKEKQLARGERRYRRKVASPKQWAAIAAAKQGPCRVCVSPGVCQLHHLVSREDHGDDVAENIVPLCGDCHDALTRRAPTIARLLLTRLSDAEYAYMIERGGEDYPERAYGVRYER